MTTESLRDTIDPKSDQLNADDLIGTTKTIKVTGVSRGSGSDQPIVVNYEGDNGRPFKPCKSMRRVLIFAWGEYGQDWIGKSMTLYADPEVKFGGVKVGGIRISHLSHIQSAISMSLTATRGKRSPYNVDMLTVKVYDQAKFDANKGAWIELIKAGKATAEQIIGKASSAGGELTATMKSELQAVKHEPNSTNTNASDKEF